MISFTWEKTFTSSCRAFGPLCHVCMSAWSNKRHNSLFSTFDVSILDVVDELGQFRLSCCFAGLLDSLCKLCLDQHETFQGTAFLSSSFTCKRLLFDRISGSLHSNGKYCQVKSVAVVLPGVL